MAVKPHIGSEANLLGSYLPTQWNDVKYIMYLQPKYKYGFHIYFTSFRCTGRYELNKLTWLLMCGFTAQLVEHRTGVAKLTGSNPVEALIFFRLLPSNCLNWKIYWNDHSSLSIATAVQIWISYIFHIVINSKWTMFKNCKKKTTIRVTMQKILEGGILLTTPN